MPETLTYQCGKQEVKVRSSGCATLHSTFMLRVICYPNINTSYYSQNETKNGLCLPLYFNYVSTI